MKVTVVLVEKPEAQLAAGDKEVLVPEGVTIPETPMPLWLNNNYNVPGDIVGRVDRVWLHEGELLADIDIHLFDIGWGGRVLEEEKTGESRVIKNLGLMTLSLLTKPRRPRG